MRLLLFLVLLLLSACFNKNTSICGGRECSDKGEAREYFKKNLTIEIAEKNKKKNNIINLVKLNTDSIESNDKKTNKNKIFNFKKYNQKKNTNKNIEIKNKTEKKLKDISKKNIQKTKSKKSFFKKITKKTKKNKNLLSNINTNKCLVLEECDIDQISKKIQKESEKKNNPDISSR